MSHVYSALSLVLLPALVLASCKVVSQSDLNGAGVTAAAVATTDVGDAGDGAVVGDVGAGICKRDAGTLATLPEYNLVQGQPCVHNRQCVRGTFCDEGATVCSEGSPGAGRTGVAPCTNGNTCTSGLCVQDASNGYTCSDACDCDQDCGGKLPKCVFVGALGIWVCARP